MWTASPAAQNEAFSLKPPTSSKLYFAATLLCLYNRLTEGAQDRNV